MRILEHAGLRLKLFSDAIAVAGNELRQFRRNRTAILISLIVLPLFFTLTIGATSGGATTHYAPTASIPVAFIDKDVSTDSGLLLQSLRGSGDFNNLVLGYREDNGLAVLGSGKIYAAIVVPVGFESSLDNNQTSSIILYTDDSEPGVADQISATLSRDVQNFNPNVVVQAETTGLGQIEVLQKGAIFSGFNVGLVIVLGVVQIFAAFYEIAGGMSREREDGTLARILVSPSGIGSIFLGKTMFDSLLTAMRTFIVLGIAVFIFGARPNTDAGTILVVSLIISLLTMGFGFLISAIRVGARAVVIIEFFLVLFLFAFTGLIIDSELLRGISKDISYALPWNYGFQILRRTLLIGAPLTSLTSYLLFVLGATVLFYVTAYAIFAFSRERLAF
jgi:ABC-type multidrug transport system permease subunit